LREAAGHDPTIDTVVTTSPAADDVPSTVIRYVAPTLSLNEPVYTEVWPGESDEGLNDPPDIVTKDPPVYTDTVSDVNVIEPEFLTVITSMLFEIVALSILNAAVLAYEFALLKNVS